MGLTPTRTLTLSYTATGDRTGQTDSVSGSTGSWEPALQGHHHG